MIEKNQLAAFFILACVIMWVLSIPMLLYPSQSLTQVPLAYGLFGPAFASIIVSAVVNPQRKQENRKRFRIGFIVFWILITDIITMYLVVTSSEWFVIYDVLLYALLALPPTFVAASAYSTIKGVEQSLSPLVHPRGNPVWYLISIVIIPVAVFLSYVLTVVTGGILLSQPSYLGPLDLSGLIALTFAFTFVIGGGLNEETGWTGFALPKLQSRFNPLISSIVLWGLWMLWHLPYHFAGWWSPTVEQLLHTMVGVFFLRIIMTWVYNRTEGGLLTGLLMHTSANVATDFIPMTYTQILVTAAIAVIVIVYDKMWRSSMNTE
jgi:membrane protease YdiL (CAAX protease family)